MKKYVSLLIFISFSDLAYGSGFIFFEGSLGAVSGSISPKVPGEMIRVIQQSGLFPDSNTVINHPEKGSIYRTSLDTTLSGSLRVGAEISFSKVSMGLTVGKMWTSQRGASTYHGAAFVDIHTVPTQVTASTDEIPLVVTIPRALLKMGFDRASFIGTAQATTAGVTIPATPIPMGFKAQVFPGTVPGQTAPVILPASDVNLTFPPASLTGTVPSQTAVVTIPAGDLPVIVPPDALRGSLVPEALNAKREGVKGNSSLIVTLPDTLYVTVPKDALTGSLNLGELVVNVPNTAPVSAVIPQGSFPVSLQTASGNRLTATTAASTSNLSIPAGSLPGTVDAGGLTAQLGADQIGQTTLYGKSDYVNDTVPVLSGLNITYQGSNVFPTPAGQRFNLIFPVKGNSTTLPVSGTVGGVSAPDSDKTFSTTVPSQTLTVQAEGNPLTVPNADTTVNLFLGPQTGTVTANASLAKRGAVQEDPIQTPDADTSVTLAVASGQTSTITSTGDPISVPSDATPVTLVTTQDQIGTAAIPNVTIALPESQTITTVNVAQQTGTSSISNTTVSLPDNPTTTTVNMAQHTGTAAVPDMNVTLPNAATTVTVDVPDQTGNATVPPESITISIPSQPVPLSVPPQEGSTLTVGLRSRGYVDMAFHMGTQIGRFHLLGKVGLAYHQLVARFVSQQPSPTLMAIKTSKVPCLLLGAQVRYNLTPSLSIGAALYFHLGRFKFKGSLGRVSPFIVREKFKAFESMIFLRYALPLF